MEVVCDAADAEGRRNRAEQDPTDEAVRRYDQKRKHKTVSNAEWESSTDGDARIAKRKDGRTHLAYKAEHMVDLKSDLVLSAEIYPANQADTATLAVRVLPAQVNVKQAGSAATIAEVVAGKGYHAVATIEMCDFLAMRSTFRSRAGPTTRSGRTNQPNTAARC